MTEDRSALEHVSDAGLVTIAVSGSPGTMSYSIACEIEMMRRLRISLLEFSRASDSWSKILAAEGAFLLLLTVALIVLTVRLILGG